MNVYVVVEGERFEGLATVAVYSSLAAANCHAESAAAHRATLWRGGPVETERETYEDGTISIRVECDICSTRIFEVLD